MSTDLDEVSRTIGIDLEGLRAKYRGVSAGTAPEEDSEKAKAAAEAFRKLDKYSACHECGGTGLKKSVYNFIKIESNCDQCDGDGLLVKAVKEIGAQAEEFDAAKEAVEGEQAEATAVIVKEEVVIVEETPVSASVSTDA